MKPSLKPGISTTKTVTTPASLEIIEWWSSLMEVPCVAIGGITVENCRPVIEAGADFLADAKRTLDDLVANAPPECRESMLGNVRLHREIAEAWKRTQ